MSAWLVGKPIKGRLRIRFPFDPQARLHFRALGINPVWSAERKVWLVNRARLPEVLHLLFTLYGPGTVVVRGNVHERCSLRCQQAKGHDCTCSCAGRNHRSGAASTWLQVGDLCVRADVTEQRYTYDESVLSLAGCVS